MTTENKNRRRRYVVRMDFQRDFILSYCAIIVGASLILSGILYVMCSTSVTTVFKDSRLKILTTADFIFPYLLISSLIAVVCAGIVCWRMTMIISNRLAGPVYRLEKDLARIGKGDLTTHVHLRQADEFKKLAETLNETVGEFRSDIRVLNEQVREIADDNGLTPQTKKVVHAAKSILAKYKV